jgi:hypothetical protein
MVSWYGVHVFSDNVNIIIIITIIIIIINLKHEILVASSSNEALRNFVISVKYIKQ